MKVLLVSTESMVCGASFSAVKLIEELVRLNVIVVPVVHSGNTDCLLRKKNIPHYIVNAWSWAISDRYSIVRKLLTKYVKKIFNFFCYRKYCKIIRQEKPDVIHVNTLTTYVAVQAALKCKIPVVWHIREMMEEDLGSSFWSEKEARSLFEKANYFIAISKCVETKFRNVVGVEKISCVYNGIDLEKFYRPHHTILNHDGVVITMAGRITQNKGQYQCLYELLPLLQEKSNVVLQFAGEGRDEELQKMRDLCAAAKLDAGQVRFLGHVDNMAELWGETDVAIVYSKCEAFGRVTIEAKMAGALVVGFNSGGTAELIRDNEDGYLFGNGFPPLNEVINKAVVNRDEMIQIAKKGQDNAVKKFTSSLNALKILEVYKRVLNV